LGVSRLAGKLQKGLTFDSSIALRNFPEMQLLLGIFVEEADEQEGEPLFRKILLKGREMNLGGHSSA
jgi:hypothetical protein